MLSIFFGATNAIIFVNLHKKPLNCKLAVYIGALDELGSIQNVHVFASLQRTTSALALDLFYFVYH